MLEVKKKKKRLKKDFVSKGKALKKQNINFIHKKQIRRNMMKSSKSPTQMGKLRLLSRNVTKERALGGQQENGRTGQAQQRISYLFSPRVLRKPRTPTGLCHLG